MRQDYLFPDLAQDAALPEGFVYQPDFLTPSDEAELLIAIRSAEFEPYDFHFILLSQ